MELLNPSEAITQNWLAALCVCSGRCVMAANGEARSQEWNDKFTASILEWLDVPKKDHDDFRSLPFGNSANDMILVMLKCKRKDEEANLKSASLDIVNDPDKLFNGLIVTCVGATGFQLATLSAGGGDAAANINSKRDKSMLKPFEYDARSRAAAFAIGEWLDMPKQFVATYETIIAEELDHAADSSKLKNASANALEDDKKRKWGWRKYAATGAGVAIAGTLVGVTAGLAAPLLAAGMGAIGIGGVGFLATTGGAAMVGSLLGAAGGGLVGKRFNKRLRGVSEFYFSKLPPNNQQHLAHSLHASIFVPGFLDEAATTSPFASLPNMMGLDMGDAYTLYFETKELTSLKNAFSSFIGASAKSAALSVVLKHTILGGLIGSLSWPLAILKIGQVIDTPWAVGMERAKRAGMLLADVLVSRAHGKRPVSLTGYSLGALAIFSCLQELYKRKIFGVVEAAVLLGLPANSMDKAAWQAACLAVSRRVVVGYSEKDWVLAFLYRANSLCSHLAGLSGVDREFVFDHTQPLAQRKLINIDLTEFVAQHGDYEDRIDDIILEISRVD